MTNYRCVLTFTRPTTLMYSSFQPFYDRVRNKQTDGWTEKLTDLHTSIFYHIFVFPKSNARKPRHFHDFTNGLEMDGRTDIHTDRHTDI